MSAHISIFFYGQYRAAYFEGENLNVCIEKAAHGIGKIQNTEARRKLQGWIKSGAKQIRDSDSCASISIEHGAMGVKLATYERDKFLDSVTALLPEYPGLNYSPILAR